MAIRFIEKVSALADILNLPNAAGIGSYNGMPFMRSEAGLIQLGLGNPGLNIFLDPANGDDDNDGLSPATAKATLDGTAGAYSLATSGQNDIIYIIGDGATTATVRVDAAFTWSKSATHLIGISSGVNISNRSRIAPTSSTTAFANFFTVSGSGCLFKNVQWFHGFNTGVAAAICMTVTGGRNLFDNCHIAGMGDAASAQSTTSRSLKISGTGENMFVSCTIGLDTVTRTVANATLEFAAATPRNQFIGCTFPFQGSAATILGIITSGSGSMDRFQYFRDCLFVNNIQSTSTTMTALCTLAASSGGLLLFGPGCCFVGITDTGSDATSFGQIYIGAPANSGTAGGAAVVAS